MLFVVLREREREMERKKERDKGRKKRLGDAISSAPATCRLVDGQKVRCRG
jgi:hypothetical protein